MIMKMEKPQMFELDGQARRDYRGIRNEDNFFLWKLL